MAELATIARPYAEALDQSVSGEQALALIAQLQSLAAVAGNADMQQLADNPKVTPKQVFDVVSGVAGQTLDARVSNLLRTVIDNGRLAALPEIAAQFNALVKSRSGVSDATIESAFPIDAAQLPQVVSALEQRFGRKLNATVVVDPALIGGVRVVVGDEVLDTSVRARLEKMRLALAA
ncbi:MAG: F0F1 ATP synthase subunit delta [Burkholderiaceae bacterium]|nr:F0F1 ATP synthase subunit delta [Burkholderiaceae bacterium]